nr:MAG: hypothetical protein OI716_00665 [Candidatus Methanoperedens sp.]WAI00060.1 MAG: hypothetical protein OI720_00510 [Candidatus Methanoperedens sp.]
MKDEIIRILEGRVKDLQSQNSFLIQDHTRISGQLDRLLMPSQEEQKEKGKKNGLSSGNRSPKDIIALVSCG